MSAPLCHRCPNPATHKVIGANYTVPVHACGQHLEGTQQGAGVPRETVEVVDDGVEALFEMPVAETKKGRNRR
jgi:hypothetical protein